MSNDCRRWIWPKIFYLWKALRSWKFCRFHSPKLTEKPLSWGFSFQFYEMVLFLCSIPNKMLKKYCVVLVKAAFRPILFTAFVNFSYKYICHICCWGHSGNLWNIHDEKYSDFWWHPFVGAEASNGESLNRIFGGDTIVERGARLSQKMFPIFNLHSALSSISSKCRSLPKGRVAMSENIVVKERSPPLPRSKYL